MEEKAQEYIKSSGRSEILKTNMPFSCCPLVFLKRIPSDSGSYDAIITRTVPSNFERMPRNPPKFSRQLSADWLGQNMNSGQAMCVGKLGQEKTIKSTFCGREWPVWDPVFDPQNPPENVYVGPFFAFFPRK